MAPVIFLCQDCPVYLCAVGQKEDLSGIPCVPLPGLGHGDLPAGPVVDDVELLGLRAPLHRKDNVFLWKGIALRRRKLPEPIGLSDQKAGKGQMAVPVRHKAGFHRFLPAFHIEVKAYSLKAQLRVILAGLYHGHIPLRIDHLHLCLQGFHEGHSPVKAYGKGVIGLLPVLYGTVVFYHIVEDEIILLSHLDGLARLQHCLDHGDLSGILYLALPGSILIGLQVLSHGIRGVVNVKLLLILYSKKGRSEGRSPAGIVPRLIFHDGPIPFIGQDIEEGQLSDILGAVVLDPEPVVDVCADGGLLPRGGSIGRIRLGGQLDCLGGYQDSGGIDGEVTPSQIGVAVGILGPVACILGNGVPFLLRGVAHQDPVLSSVLHGDLVVVDGRRSADPVCTDIHPLRYPEAEIVIVRNASGDLAVILSDTGDIYLLRPCHDQVLARLVIPDHLQALKHGRILNGLQAVRHKVIEIQVLRRRSVGKIPVTVMDTGKPGGYSIIHIEGISVCNAKIRIGADLLILETINVIRVRTQTHFLPGKGLVSLFFPVLCHNLCP